MVADGLFMESGYFYVMPKVDIQLLAELFRAKVLTMLKKEGLIDDSFINTSISTSQLHTNDPGRRRHNVTFPKT
ncbi:MAG: hypothetical protein GY799_03205 [Desulfobulbaceae bacterium]|nr:hypothetical protein [Desulfobulbaceae bacterium]